MSYKAFKTVIIEIKLDKYYSIIVNTKSNISHCDRIFIIRTIIKKSKSLGHLIPKLMCTLW